MPPASAPSPSGARRTTCWARRWGENVQWGMKAWSGNRRRRDLPMSCGILKNSQSRYPRLNSCSYSTKTQTKTNIKIMCWTHHHWICFTNDYLEMYISNLAYMENVTLFVCHVTFMSCSSKQFWVQQELHVNFIMYLSVRTKLHLSSVPG